METLLTVLRGVFGSSPIEVVVLVLARVLPLVAFTPVFGGPQAPQTFRLGLGVTLAFAISPAVASHVAAPGSGFDFGVAIGSEILTGVMLAVAVRIVFDVLGGAAALIDLSRGVTFSNFLDPWTQNQTSPLSPFLVQLQLAAFASIGGLRFLVAGLARSYEVAPAGRAISGLSGEGVAAFASLAGETFVLALRLAAPAVSVTFLVDVALALLNRIAPLGSGGLFFLSLTVKPILGLLAVLLTAGLALDVVLGEMPSLLSPFLPT